MAAPNVSAVVERLPPIFADEAGVVEHIFRVKNPTAKHVRVTEVRHSCSCTEGTIDSTELGPGETTDLHVRVDLRGRQGEFAAQCIVANDTEEPWVYELRMRIFTRIEFSPERLRFDSVKPRSELVRNVTLCSYARREAPGEPQLSITSASDVKVSVVGPSTVERLSEGIVCRKTVAAVRLLPQEMAGSGSCDLTATVLMADGPRSSTTRIEWFVDNPFVITPARAFFGSVKPTDGLLSREVRIRRSDDKTFTLISVRTDRVAVTCLCAKGTPSKEHKIIFTLDPRRFTMFEYGEAVIETDAPVPSNIRVPFAASN